MNTELGIIICAWIGGAIIVIPTIAILIFFIVSGIKNRKSKKNLQK